MVCDNVHCDTMSQKVKKEKKKKMWGKLVSSSPDVVVSAATSADGAKLSSSPSSSRKRKCSSLHRVFRRILSVILPCVSSDPEVDLQDATHEKEAIRDIAGDQSSPSSTEDTSSSAESSPSDLETSGGYTSTSAVGVSSEESGKIDLLEAAAVLEDAAGDQSISDVDLDWWVM